MWCTENVVGQWVYDADSSRPGLVVKVRPTGTVVVEFGECVGDNPVDYTRREQAAGHVIPFDPFAADE